MLSTVETVDTHLDRAHAALQYLDQGLRSAKCAEQISAVYAIEKVVQTFGSIIVILDAVWLKVVDFGLKCPEVAQSVLLDCLQRLTSTLRHVTNSTLLLERIAKVVALDASPDHMPYKLQALIQAGLAPSKVESVKSLTEPFLVKSSVRVMDAAVQKSNLAMPDLGAAKQIVVDIVASGLPSETLQVDVFVSKTPLMPPYQSLSQIRTPNLHMVSDCVANQVGANDLGRVPYLPSLPPQQDSEALLVSEEEREVLLLHADGPLYACRDATAQDYPTVLGDRQSAKRSLLPHFRWTFPVDPPEASVSSMRCAQVQTTCIVRGNEDVSWEFWDKRRATRRAAGLELHWYIYVVVRSIDASSSSLVLPDRGGIYCVAG